MKLLFNILKTIKTVILISFKLFLLHLFKLIFKPNK